MSIPTIPTVLLRIGLLLYTAPAVLALIWLLGQTDWAELAANPSLLLFVALPAFLLGRLAYFTNLRSEFAPLALSDGSLARAWIVAELFFLGPGALWIAVGLILVEALLGWTSRPHSPSLGKLVELSALRLVGYLAYHAWVGPGPNVDPAPAQRLTAIAIAIALPHLADPFGVLAVMFPAAHLAVWRFPDQFFYEQPDRRKSSKSCTPTGFRTRATQAENLCPSNRSWDWQSKTSASRPRLCNPSSWGKSHRL